MRGERWTTLPRSRSLQVTAGRQARFEASVRRWGADRPSATVARAK